MKAVTPDWVKDAVFYQIFPDRFARSKVADQSLHLEPWDAPPTSFGFKGGDLDGVIERLDYLQDLGVNVLYFNPIFQSTANHRYHTHDYFRVDPVLGGNAAFRRLIDAAHQRSMRVIVDGVFNHASRGFFQFNHTLENGKDSPYIDWFHFNQEWLESGRPLKPYEPIPVVSQKPNLEMSLEQYGYRAWWDIPSLPKFNTKHPQVREFIMEVGEFWIDFGVDGWRLDVPHEIDDDSFWQEFRGRIKSRNSEAYIVGEIWKDATRWLGGDQFDAVTNYLFTRPVLGACLTKLNRTVLQRCNFRNLETISAMQLGLELQELVRKYPQDITYAQMNLLGSHDTPRVMTMAAGDQRAVAMATALMFFYVGSPCIYYGDEIGMKGGHDPDCRWGFPWERPESWDLDLLGLHKDLAVVRRRHVALRRGDFTNFPQSNQDTLLLERSYANERLFFSLNTSNMPAEVHLPAHFNKDGRRLVGGKWLRSDAVVLQRGAQGSTLLVPPQEWIIWQS